MVIQFNKRDLPHIRSDAEIERIAAKGSEPIYRATAIKGLGVAETFLGLAELTWAQLEQRYELGARFGLGASRFMENLRRVVAA